jgi:repressor LexA
MATALTDIERRILDFMVDYLRSNTYQPSIREIGERFGIKSTKTVSEHLQALADKGFLERDPSRSRGVRILGVDLNLDAVSLPCYRDLADVRGTRPDRAESFLTLDRKLVPQRGAFVVRAAGESLAVLGVSEGDYLLVEPTSIDQVEDGAVLVVRDGEGSVYRRLTRNGRGVYLHDLRAGRDPLLVDDPAQVELVGRVSALIHRMDGRTSMSLTAH